MSVRSGQSITKLFTTRVFSTGVGTNADSLPAGTLYVNGTANGATVTVTNVTTGLYKAAVTLPTLAIGDVVDLRINATVSSVTDNAIIWSDSKDVLLDASGKTTDAVQTGDSYAVVNSGTFGNAAIKDYVDDIGAAGAGLTALGDTRLAHLNADVDSRMATYTQPTGFLAASFPSDPADASDIAAAFTALQSHGDLDWATATGFASTSDITTAEAAILAKLLKYVQLLARKDAAIATDNAAELTAINASGGSGAGSYTSTTDSLEAAAVAAAAVKAKTDLLGTAGMTYPALVMDDGVTFAITAGYDYDTAEGRRLVWTSDQWPDLTGVTAVELLTDAGDVLAGSLIAYGGPTQSVGVALTAAQTATLRGQVGYQLRATHANTHKTDLVPRGTIDSSRLM